MKIAHFFSGVLGEVGMSIILVLILLSFLKFSALTMPMNISVLAIALLIVLFLAYASTIWKEHAQDEREEHHRLLAGRFGYLMGAGVLVVAAVVQLAQHELDHWIVVALVSMILSKTIARLYFQVVS